jgi:hypothetical protein
MSILNEHPELLEQLSQEMTPKFLATRSAEGVPNVVPCTSIMPAGDVDDRLILGNFLLRKSVGNLDSDPRVAVMVLTEDLRGWVLRGRFEGWQRAGPYVDRLNSTDLLRYNPYTGIRSAGIIQVLSLEDQYRISKLRVLSEYLLARLARRSAARLEAQADSVAMPPVVRKGFSPMMALRVLAFLDGSGQPGLAPILSLQPAGSKALVGAGGLATGSLEALAPGAPVATSLLTLDAISFQAKGTWLGGRRLAGQPWGAMAVNAVFAGGPPIPGRQVA